jgi:hypothetical protein
VRSSDEGTIARHRLDRGQRGLSAGARRVARATLEALLSDEDDEGRLVPGAPAACERGVAWLDDSLGRSSPDLRRGFAVLAFALEWLPLFVVGAPRRMSRMPLDRRVAYLSALEESRIGWLSMLLVAFKVPLSLAAFEEGEELASTGFDRPTLASRRGRPTSRSLPLAPEPP